MTIPLDSIANMPAFFPYYPSPPARYRGVKFQFVYFRADVAAVERVLPSCLEPADDGFCAAIGLTVPWSDNYGPFEESVLVVGCRFEEQRGFFAPVAFLNSTNSIPAGREIYGTPKVSGEIVVSVDESQMMTDTRQGGTSIFRIRTTTQQAAMANDFPDLSPSWRLKVIPRADGPGAAVCQLVDVTSVLQDVTVHVRRKGEGVVEFDPKPRPASRKPGELEITDLSDFTPLEYLGAGYLEMDYSEGYGEIVRDFLAE